VPAKKYNPDDPTAEDPREGEFALVPVPQIEQLPIKVPKSLSRRKLKQAAEQAMVEATKLGVLQSFWSAIKAGLDAGDGTSMKLVADMFQYAQKSGGINVMNVQQNVNQGGGGTTSQEEIIRMLEARDRKEDQSGVVDAEFEEA
jgi:hypothetical protein